MPYHIFDSEPGDIVAFDLRLWHSSYGGSSDRHMCTCVYYNNPRTREEIESTRFQGANMSKTTAQYHRPNDPLIDPTWFSNTEGNPKRKRWLERLYELGYFQDAKSNNL